MKKAELIEAVAANSGLSKADSGRALESFVETVSKALKKGDEVSIRGFGKFSVARRSAGGSHRKRATPGGLGIEASFVSAASRSKQAGSPRGTSSSSRGRSRHPAGDVFDDELRSLLGDDVSPDLAVARRAARWALAEQAWEQRLEAIWDAKDVARALNVSKQRVSVLVRKHRLIALPQNGRLRFPVWQFAGLDGADRACLARRMMCSSRRERSIRGRPRVGSWPDTLISRGELRCSGCVTAAGAICCSPLPVVTLRVLVSDLRPRPASAQDACGGDQAVSHSSPRAQAVVLRRLGQWSFRSYRHARPGRLPLG